MPEIAVGLWRLAEDSVLFARTEERDGLFRSAVDPALLSVLEGWKGAEILAVALTRADVRAAAEGCADLAEAAAAMGAPITAASFAEARALLLTADPRAALDVAMLARARADHVAAEWWGLRAVYLARRSGDWACVGQGYMRVAAVWEERGDYRRAVKYRVWQYSAARKAGAPVLAARAMHSLHAVFQMIGDRESADRCAAKALRLYPAAHPRLRALAHDIALVRLRDGEARAALQAFKSLWWETFPLRETLFLVANTARAAALSRDRRMYEIAVERAEEALKEYRYGDGAAWTLATLARAALSMGDSTRSLRLAEAARALGTVRGEPEPVQIAEEVLATAADEQSASG